VLKVFLAGRVVVETDGVVIDERAFPGRQGRLLFAYLACEDGRAVPRGEFAEVLWGDEPPATWEKALSVLVSKLRVVLGGNGIDGASALTGAFGCYRLELPDGSWVDVLAAASATAEAEQALAAGETEIAKAAASVAESLVRQPFLPGDEGVWIDAKRHELAEVRARAVGVLADVWLRSANRREAVKWAEQAIVLEPFREGGYRRLMQAHIAAGDRAEALRTYDRCRRLLADELGTYPSPETESIYRALLETPAQPAQTSRPEAPPARMGDQDGAAVELQAARSGPDPSPRLQLDPAILPRDPSLAPQASRTTHPLGPTESSEVPAKGSVVHARRLRLALGGVALVALVALAVVAAMIAPGRSHEHPAVIAVDSVGAIRPSSGALSAVVPVGSSPTGVAAGAGAVWVADYNAGTVSRIDLATRAVVAPIPVGSTPTGIAVGADAVWVANGYSGTVSRIDPSDDSVASITVGNGPSGVAVGDGFVWVANSSDGTLSRIDPLSDTATTIPLGGATEATDVAVGEGAVWVSDAADGRVLRIDPDTKRVTAINVGNGPTAITVGFGSVWVTNSLDGTISRINAHTRRVTAAVQVGSGPDAIAAGAGGVWVANEFDGTVVRIDPATNAPARPIAVGNSPRGLAVAGGLVWVSTEASVTRVPTSGPGLTQPTSPSGTKMSGGTVYFTEGADSTPYYIFPMYSFNDCTTSNVNQLIDMLYRPLYWYGNNYRPTVDHSYSIGRPPVFSDGDKTVTITLNPWKWSDGESVTSRDLAFWMNVVKASPSTEWCGYAPGYFPDLVTSYSEPSASTFVLHFNKAYDPEWVIYNVLSQLTPLPLAWDRTSLTQPAPRSDNGHLPDTTKAGAAAIYKFLDGQAKKLAGWASSPLWRVVDGPFRLQSFTSTGEVTLVPNPSYSGSPKPTISKLVELPYTSDAAIDIALRSGGPSAVTVANLPPEYAPAIPTLTAEGYHLNTAASYSFTYFPLNLNSSATTSPGGEPVRYVFRQAYFRRALQHLVDQQGWITAFFLGSANPTCGPIPLSPPSPLVNPATLSTQPCAFSVAAAGQLLSANGWNVVPGGTTTCVRPGTRAGECGAGIKAGEGISFTVDYASGVVSVHEEMKDLAAQARRVGINLSLTTHPFDTVIGISVPCTPTQATCNWQAENAGAYWVYGPDYLPTGEQLYDPGDLNNAGSYRDPKMTQLIQASIAGPAASEATALRAYDKYAEERLPVIFGPAQIGTYANDAGTLVAKNLGGYAANAFGMMNPEDWYFTR
jgi:peptide/nickel transport system substrate-binding protein